MPASITRPIPSSQIACTIGGNVAENSGGVHCLKYGMTTNNVLGCEIVLITGEVIRLGGKHLDAEGYDLLGLITGSEGLLGVVTEVTVRILKKPETARAVLVGFPTIGGRRRMRLGDHRRRHHSRRHGDDGQAGDPFRAKDFVHAGYPLDVEALLIVEVDGPQAEADDLIERIEIIASKCHAVSCEASTSEATTAAVLGRTQGGVPGSGTHLARLLLHGRHHPARQAAAGARVACARCRRNTACASPTCSMPATETCTR